MQFVHVEGNHIVDGDGNYCLLKGIAFGNNVWAGPDEPVLTDHDESSYKDIAEMGFNCVRYYMNYQLFEDDSAPYEYKESGFDWIDENIKWAKKNNIGIILNMHWPQGGYQSQANGTALWTDPENQERLIALWGEFARRYADEPTVIGYGLINEPIVPQLATVEESVNQCRDLMQRITDEIRQYDQNHIIFAERVCALQDMNTLAGNWNMQPAETLFLLDDNNTAYEFHCYDPYSFTHQNLRWAGTEGITPSYPSDEWMALNILDDWVGCSGSSATAELDDGWVEYKSTAVSKTGQYNIGSITLRAQNTGDETVFFDDVKVEAYKDGELVKTVKELDFDDAGKMGDFYFWAADGNGGSSYSDNGGYNGSGCYAITGTTSDANMSGCKFALEDGFEYVLTAKVKASKSVKAEARIDFSLAENAMTLGYEYLESILKEYVQFGIDHNVPVYLGEFGADIHSFENNRGGERYVADMLDICKKYTIHFTYHTYHEDTFGLYMNAAYSLPDNKNDLLADVFIKSLK
ncbi:MAG TPA: cellulase family glycosylhydrolase [Firmicutes bacterium]|nr:cellulase family glycosylhydrolase [Bacillota bacterium]